MSADAAKKPGKPAKPRGGKKFTAGRVMRWIVILALAPLSGFVVWLWMTLPDVRSLKSGFPEKTSLMEYRDAEYARKNEKVRPSYRPIPLRLVSPHLRHAVIASEDSNFYGHHGFDFDGIQEALEKNLEKGRPVRGGSTITQQLAKNLYLTPKKSYVRKIREAAITRRLEERLPKDRILELYLNVAEWGRGIYGCEAASRHWFSKSCLELSPREAALLAAMLPAPRKFNPDKKTSRAFKRQQKILYWMCLGNKLPESDCAGVQPPT